ncbi:YbfB/YjiJ family MFS transporter [Nonomuraea sp. NPDC052129]|uniref:YbfB/YjiJ family MFS transporter n=1 Tax=Nonomuraea sp. NPDC052129 TaxID=3154651 RepID=UPI00343F7F75
MLQAVGIALAGVVPGEVSALVAAVAFGGTFVGISSLALALGEHLQLPRAVALLTAGYGIGQIIGPPVSQPLLGTSYSAPLLLGGVIVAASPTRPRSGRSPAKRAPVRRGQAQDEQQAHARRKPTPCGSGAVDSFLWWPGSTWWEARPARRAVRSLSCTPRKKG